MQLYSREGLEAAQALFEMAAPGNTWYFLVYEPDKSSPPPIVDKASFAKMSEMRLPVATARGIRWEGDGKNEVMFQQSGTYEVILTKYSRAITMECPFVLLKLTDYRTPRRAQF